MRARSTALLRTAYLLVADHGHAEDLLQTALLRTLQHWRTARTAPEAYVRQALLNLCRDNWRRARVRPRELPLLAGADSPVALDGPADQVSQRRELVAALSRLPMAQRAVIVLRFVEDLSVAETAQSLRISEGTVKSYTSRAIATLRGLLDSDCAADDHHFDHDAAEVHRAH